MLKTLANLYKGEPKPVMPVAAQDGFAVSHQAPDDVGSQGKPILTSADEFLAACDDLMCDVVNGPNNGGVTHQQFTCPVTGAIFIGTFNFCRVSV